MGEKLKREGRGREKKGKKGVGAGTLFSFTTVTMKMSDLSKAEMEAIRGVIVLLLFIFEIEWMINDKNCLLTRIMTK